MKFKILIYSFLLIIFSFIASGSLVKYKIEGGKKFVMLKDITYFLATIPSTFNQIINNPNILTNLKNFEHPDKPVPKEDYKNLNTEINKDYKKDLLIVIPRYNNNIKQSQVDIYDLLSHKIIHTYTHDIESMNKLVDETQYENENNSINHSKIRFQYRHPIILEDGSLISKGEYGPLFKINECGLIKWINDTDLFHHSIEFDNDKNFIWVPSVLRPNSEIVLLNTKGRNIHDDAITKVDINDGKIVFQKSVLEILIKNDILNDRFIFSLTDPIHLNDIEIARNDSLFWNKGDLFLSLRNLSSIVQYRPSTDEVINYIKGPFYAQHDIDFISNSKISIFNNNVKTLKKADDGLNLFHEDDYLSQVLEYNFVDKKFSKILKKTIKKYSFKNNGILIDFTPEKDFLLEDPDSGLLIMGDKDENINFQLVNKDFNDDIYFFSWSRLIQNLNIVQSIRKIYNQSNCN